MKEKTKYILALGTLSILFGLLLSLRRGQKIESYSLISLNSIQAMKNEIEDSKNEIISLENLIDEKSEKLDQLEIITNKDDDRLKKYINYEIETIKSISGLRDMKGPGIRVVIADNEDKQIIGKSIQDDIIHDSEIQIILNDLKNAGAEAISINGERVIYKSEVKCGGPIIRINGKSSANPFIIEVIGDPKVLYSSLTAKESFGWTLKEVYNKKVEVEIKDNIYISKYNWLDPNFKYVDPIKEGD